MSLTKPTRLPTSTRVQFLEDPSVIEDRLADGLVQKADVSKLVVAKKFTVRSI